MQAKRKGGLEVEVEVGEIVTQELEGQSPILYEADWRGIEGSAINQVVASLAANWATRRDKLTCTSPANAAAAAASSCPTRESLRARQDYDRASSSDPSDPSSGCFGAIKAHSAWLLESSRSADSLTSAQLSASTAKLSAGASNGDRGESQAVGGASAADAIRRKTRFISSAASSIPLRPASGAPSSAIPPSRGVGATTCKQEELPTLSPARPAYPICTESLECHEESGCRCCCCYCYCCCCCSYYWPSSAAEAARDASAFRPASLNREGVAAREPATHPAASSSCPRAWPRRPQCTRLSIIRMACALATDSNKNKCRISSPQSPTCIACQIRPLGDGSNNTWKRRRRGGAKREPAAAFDALCGSLSESLKIAQRRRRPDLPLKLCCPKNKALNNSDDRPASSRDHHLAVNDAARKKCQLELKLNSPRRIRTPSSGSKSSSPARIAPQVRQLLALLTLMLTVRTQAANKFVSSVSQQQQQQQPEEPAAAAFPPQPASLASQKRINQSSEQQWQLISPEIDFLSLFSDPKPLPEEVGASSVSARGQRAEHRNLHPTSGAHRRIRTVSSPRRDLLLGPHAAGDHFERHSGHESWDTPPSSLRAQTAPRKLQHLARTDSIGREASGAASVANGSSGNLLLLRPPPGGAYQTSSQLLMLSHHQPALLGNFVSSFPHLSLCAQVKECTCTWKNGKQSADCSRGQLTEIPTSLDPLTQVLNFSSNPLSQLVASAFQAANLSNLQRIYLSSCQLENVHPRAFERLKLVVELELSWNKLAKVPLIQISQLKLLRKLSMRGNPLGSLDETTFITILPLDGTGTISSGSVPSEVSASEEPQGTTELDSIAETGGNNPQLSLLLLGPLGEAHKWNASTRASLSRLLETYPDLSGALISFAHQLDAGSASGRSGSSGLPASSKSLSRAASGLVAIQAGEWGGGQLMIGLMELLRSLQLESELDSTDTLSSSNRLAASVAAENPEQQQYEEGGLLASHFNHLQELDFGHCQLSYISWKAFQGLSQLKRLHLDNNRLSQLSGRLIRAFPLGLHQLALEGNPFVCDCRLLALKRWLLNTKTPLSGPVKCHQDVPTKQLKQRQQQQQQQQHLERKTSNRRGAGNSSVSTIEEALSATRPPWDLESRKAASNEPARLQDSTRFSETSEPSSRLSVPRNQLALLAGSHESTTIRRLSGARLDAAAAAAADTDESGANLAELALDHFVCAPQVAGAESAGKLVAVVSPTSTTSSSTAADAGKQRDGRTPLESSSPQVQPEQLIHYLSETLVVHPPRKDTPSGSFEVPGQASRNFSHQSSHSTRLLTVLAHEADRITLRCPLIVYPAWSVHFIWLADYSSHRGLSPHSSHAFRVLYDSRVAALEQLELHHEPTRSRSRHARVLKRRELVTDTSITGSSVPSDPDSSEDCYEEDSPEQDNAALPRPLGTGIDSGSSSDETKLSSRVLQHGARLSFRDFSGEERQRKALEGGGPHTEFALRESQLIIQSALHTDSARYRCIARNAAGNASLEFMLRVSPLVPSGTFGTSMHSAAAAAAAAGAQRDLRHHPTTSDPSSLEGASKQSTRTQQFSRFQQRGEPQTSPMLEASTPVTPTPSRAPPSAWLKSSTTFQVTIVLVSLLMGAVIVAFLLFCVVIYQIKPTTNIRSDALSHTMGARASLALFTSSGAPPFEVRMAAHEQVADGSFGFLSAPLARTATDNTSNSAGTTSTSSPNTVNLTATVNCDPITGHSPVHLIAQAVTQLPSQIALAQQTFGAGEAHFIGSSHQPIHHLQFQQQKYPSSTDLLSSSKFASAAASLAPRYSMSSSSATMSHYPAHNQPNYWNNMNTVQL